MQKTKLSSKGQVILPKAVRVAHQWESGVEFAVEEVEEGVLLRPIKSVNPTQLKDVIGCSGYQGPPKSLEEMEKAIARGTRKSR